MTVMQMFADDITAAHGSDAPITLETTYGAEGTEPSVAVLIDGHAVFHFRRDELLDAIYTLGCDVIEELEKAGQSAYASPSDAA